MTVIPEDIRATAEKIADVMTDCVSGSPDGGCEFDITVSRKAIAEALMTEREAENQRWKDLDETARESGLMLGPIDLAEAVMNERERSISKALAEKLEDPQDEADRAYNTAIDHVIDAIRSPDTPTPQDET